MAMVDTKAKKTRRHPRVKSSKGLFVAWETGSRRAVSRLETLSLGGVFIHTSEPPPVGSALNILIDMQNGDVRARAVVRRVAPGKGMGIEFISMTPEDRARLNKQLQQILGS
jgi:PilZ domain